MVFWSVKVHGVIKVVISHGIPYPLTIFATLGHGEVSCVLGEDLVKRTLLSLAALEIILSGLLSGTGSGSND